MPRRYRANRLCRFNEQAVIAKRNNARINKRRAIADARKAMHIAARHIASRKRGVFQNERGFKKIGIASENDSVFLHIAPDNVKRLAVCNAEPLALSDRIAPLTVVLSEYFTVQMNEIARRVVAGRNSFEKFAVIAVGNKANILTVGLVCRCDSVFGGNFANLFFVYSPSGA